MKQAAPSILTKSDFETLSEFRHQMRRFQRFSEHAAQAEGITPLQYLLLLHIKGFPGRAWASVGELAERLQAQPHGVVALVSRCEAAGLVVRRPADASTGARSKCICWSRANGCSIIWRGCTAPS
jgi:DNA-binding MarR family transcriptional regulator